MTAAPFPRPLVPEDIDRRSDPARTLFRAMTSHVVARARARDGVAADVASEFWPSDKVTKAAVNPATVGTAAWAGNVSPTGVAAFLSGLAPRSAAAQLFEAALRVDLAGQNSVNVPRLSTNPAPNFVAEGAPIPVEQGTFADTAVGPAKNWQSSRRLLTNSATIRRKARKRSFARACKRPPASNWMPRCSLQRRPTPRARPAS